MVDTEVCQDKPQLILLLRDCEARQHAEEAKDSKKTAEPRAKNLPEHLLPI